MHQITVKGTGLTGTAAHGESLLSCLRRMGLGVESTCNGRGACGKCRVVADGGLTEPDEKERAHLEGQAPNVRLACRAEVVGNVSVTLDNEWTQLQSVFAQEFRTRTPHSLLERVALPEKGKNSRPYVESVPYGITDPRVLAKIASWDGARDEAYGLIFDGELLDIHFERKPLLGAAIDVGTTSLSLYLFDLTSGELLGKTSALNPQVSYGGDVITRIHYCRQNPDGVSILRSELAKQLAVMIDDALGTVRRREDLWLIAAAGNTTMLHILAGVSPVSLGLAPFRPTFLKPLVVPGENSGLPMNPQGRLVLLPGASAYIGADIVGGLAAIDDEHRATPTLFVDIGTNGEIVLIDRQDRLIATSCAMGPALEGRNISCGCRAVPGAIDSVVLNHDLVPRFTTIGGLPPVGICGSGLVDLVAELVGAGVIGFRGAFEKEAHVRQVPGLREDHYYLTDRIFLSQKDVRQVQMAKSAVITGILTLLNEAGHAVADLAQIIVAGSFGYHLNPQNLRRIGFLPDDFHGPIAFVGNSSLSGASLALLHQEVLAETERLASRIRVVDLSSHPSFRDRFISELAFKGRNRGEQRPKES